MTDRVVHATSDTQELVRYDREGRWYLESKGLPSRKRMKTVHDAVVAALELEATGGVIHLGRAGGGRFDYGIESAREKQARGR